MLISVITYYDTAEPNVQTRNEPGWGEADRDRFIGEVILDRIENEGEAAMMGFIAIVDGLAVTLHDGDVEKYMDKADG